MDNLEFDTLVPDAKIKFMNDNLKNGLTLTTISDEIKISRKTIAKKLKKIGYKYDLKQKQFLKMSEYDHIIPITQHKTAEDKEVVRVEYKSNTNIFNTKEAKNKMLSILKKHDDIEEMLQWYHNQRNVIEAVVSELRINGDKLTGKAKITTVRVYEDVWEQFRSFMSEHTEYKSMDLISMAMVEYIEKYKK